MNIEDKVLYCAICGRNAKPRLALHEEDHDYEDMDTYHCWTCFHVSSKLAVEQIRESCPALWYYADDMADKLDLDGYEPPDYDD